jgi:hypothetical protein
MEPVNAAAEVLGWSIAGGLLMLAAVEVRHWMKTGSSNMTRPRPHYISDRELELTGDDWRVHADDYFRKWSKRKAIVKEVCRGDQ